MLPKNSSISPMAQLLQCENLVRVNVVTGCRTKITYFIPTPYNFLVSIQRSTQEATVESSMCCKNLRSEI